MRQAPWACGARFDRYVLEAHGSGRNQHRSEDRRPLVEVHGMGVAARLPLKALVAAIDAWVVHRGCQRIVTGLPTLFLRAVLAVVGMGMH